MFTQFHTGCPEPAAERTCTASRALVAPRHSPAIPPVCTGLAARLRIASKKAQQPAPVILPGMAVSLFSVLLPVKSHRQREKALAFALEEQLCGLSDQTHLTLGPSIEGDHYLVAACDDGALAAAVGDTVSPGAALPDTLGVPRPEIGPFSWNIWCENEVVYTRAADGTGFVCRADQFTLFWKVAGKPKLFSLAGSLPGGPEAKDISENPPPVDEADLTLNLRHGKFRHRKTAPRRFVRAVASIMAVGVLGQFGVLAADARALSKIAADRTGFVSASLSRISPELSADQPLRLIAARLSVTDDTQTQDPFMTVLANVSEALKPQSDQISFRELRYGAREGVVTLLIQGREFGPLQSAEAALIDAGLEVTSGTATATESGAEVLLQIRGSQ